MNMNQLTQKTVAALQRAQSLAVEYGHVDVQQEHLLAALTENPQDLVPQLLQRCGISLDAFRRALEDGLNRFPRVSGSGVSQPGYAADIEKALLEAEKTAKFFPTVEVPFIPAEEIPSVKSSKKRLGSLRGAIRRNYLDHCTLDMNEGTLKASLAKKIVKDTCPSCAAPIVGAVSDTYVCKSCGNKILDVIVKK